MKNMRSDSKALRMNLNYENQIIETLSELER